MIGFVTWPPYIKDDGTKRWPSDKANHSCGNALHTVLTITYNNNTYFTVKKVLGQSEAMHNGYK